jgi:hypothetical protein
MVGKGVAKKEGQKVSSGNFPEDKGRTLERAARVTGRSGPPEGAGASLGRPRPRSAGRARSAGGLAPPGR